MIDCLIVSLLVSSYVLFLVGRAQVRRNKRRQFRVVRSSQAGGINRRKFFSQ